MIHLLGGLGLAVSLSYMGNRKRLPPGHRYRYKKAWSVNTLEERNAKRIQNSAEIYETLLAFRYDFGRPRKIKEKDQSWKMMRWFKKKGVKNQMIFCVGRRDQYSLNYLTGR